MHPWSCCSGLSMESFQQQGNGCPKQTPSSSQLLIQNVLSQVPVTLLVKTFPRCWTPCVLPSARDAREETGCDGQPLSETATCHKKCTQKLFSDHMDDKAWCREVITPKAGPLAWFSQRFGVVTWWERRRAFYFCRERGLEGSLEGEAKKCHPDASCWTKPSACKHTFVGTYLQSVYAHRHTFLGLCQLSVLRDPKIQTNHLSQKEVVNRDGEDAFEKNTGVPENSGSDVLGWNEV